MKEKKRGKKNKTTQQYEPYTEIEILDGSSNGTTSSSSKVVHASELKSIAKDQIKHSSPETAKLIDWLADVNRHQISDVTGGQVTWNADKGLFATPLGIVPASAISKARTLLNDISDYVVDHDLKNRQFTGLVEQYLTIIPHNLGMRWSPETFLPSITQVQRENGVLDALDASYASAITVVPTKGKKQKKVPKVFETKLVLVNDGKIIDRINKKFKESLNRNHHRTSRMKLVKVWQVDVEEMSKAFDNYGRKLSNIKELWHGSNPSNLLSVLRLGLRTRPPTSVHITGNLFGSGIYASSQSSKALNYATSFWGNNDLGRYFMFVVDFAMGNMYIPKRSNYSSIRYPVKGYDSTFAQAGVSGVMNNEEIVYKDNQANLKFLCEFS